jgi:hypothetical protein
MKQKRRAVNGWRLTGNRGIYDMSRDLDALLGSTNRIHQWLYENPTCTWKTRQTPIRLSFALTPAWQSITLWAALTLFLACSTSILSCLDPAASPSSLPLFHTF